MFWLSVRWACIRDRDSPVSNCADRASPWISVRWWNRIKWVRNREHRTQNQKWRVRDQITFCVKIEESPVSASALLHASRESLVKNTVHMRGSMHRGRDRTRQKSDSWNGGILICLRRKKWVFWSRAYLWNLPYTRELCFFFILPWWWIDRYRLRAATLRCFKKKCWFSID